MSAVDVATVPINPRARRRRLLRKRFLRRPLAVAGLVVALLFVGAAIFAPWVAPYSASATDFNATLAPPFTNGHLLGTDELGRDVFSRIIWGSRASIMAGVLATMLAMVIAVPIGLVAGYYRGWVDTVVARLTDVLLAFPFLIIAVGLAAILGPSLKNATIALGIGAAPGLIRVARGETFALREEDYVRAAIANGASDVAIISRHILPNMTLDADRAGDGDDPGSDHRRGRALVPRTRRPAADALVGRDARRCSVVSLTGAAAGAVSRGRDLPLLAVVQPARRRACATSSTRGRRV